MAEENDLSKIATSELVKELNKRFAEMEDAKKQLRFEPVAVRMRPPKTGVRTGGKSPTMSNAAFGRWAGWKAYKKAHKGATTQDYFKARAAGKA